MSFGALQDSFGRPVLLELVRATHGSVVTRFLDNTVDVGVLSHCGERLSTAVE